MQYEGEEQSKNVFYTGRPAEPAAQSGRGPTCSNEGYRKFYLLGTDYVFPRTANKVLKAYLKYRGIPDANIIEEYTPFHHQDYQTIVQKIKNFATGWWCVRSLDDQRRQQRAVLQGVRQPGPDPRVIARSWPSRWPKTSCGPWTFRPLVGHLATWNYFQSIDTPENQKFVQDFKAFCKAKGLK